LSAYLVHVGYFLMLCALVARDILWLRAMLACAQGVLAAYAFAIAVRPIALWNVLFVAINVAWVARIVLERRAVALSPELADLRERHFSAMSVPEFLRFWRMGTRTRLRDAVLTDNGRRPSALYFVLQGRATVRRNGHLVADLGPGQFAGEMSLVTMQPANADVQVAGSAEVIAWPVEELLALRDGQSPLWTHLQAAIGLDLVGKIRRGDEARLPGDAADPSA
jgi:CRP-like cAMP-binding protein